MVGLATELARRLAEDAEAVCREYLSNGRRSGNHWIVGDVRNTKGRSMHVRLTASAKGPAGKWVDQKLSGAEVPEGLNLKFRSYRIDCNGTQKPLRSCLPLKLVHDRPGIWSNSIDFVS